jgi:uncharacterized membrane protein YagU involved in acid resistance
MSDSVAVREDETVSRASPQSKLTAATQSILLGGLIAGTLDIGAACLINWRSPTVIFHAIASGVLGTASFQMGARSAVLGLLLQWFMSILIAGIYVIASYRFPALRRRWILAGCAYGVPVFLVMNYVVLPLSAVGHVAHFTIAKAAANLLAMIWFGFVIAYFARDRFAVVSDVDANPIKTSRS